MKKLQVIVFALLITLPNLSAFAGDEHVKKGLRAGYQMSNFYSNGNSYGDNLHSFYVGAFGEKKVIPLLRFGIGLEYNSTGFTSSDLLIGDDFKYTRHALALPIYAKVKLGPVFVLGGVAPEFGISDKASLLGKNYDLSDDDKSKGFDAPVFLGAGFSISIVSIEARYNWGTMNLSKIDNTNKNQQYFQVGASILF